jgi:hypothetical protein
MLVTIWAVTMGSKFNKEEVFSNFYSIALDGKFFQLRDK